MIDQIILTAQNDARAKKQILNIDINQDIYLETDRYILLSAIANLVQNAIKYSKLEGHITLRAGLSGNEVVIEIEDECSGLNPEVSENIFKPFYSKNTTSSSLGLGLTITQRAVNLLNGHISVVNNSGNGCAFIIHIPQKYIQKITPRAVAGEDSVQPKIDNKI